MAQYSGIKSSVAILIIGIITFSMFAMMSSSASLLSEHESADKSPATLMIDETMMGYYRSRARSMAETNRVSPGGPDKIHH
ncbi:hypothetical protein CASFOL_019896 [Castilleja foliolosa]|uniref:CLAVATA3/ESR (CLE)-related protein n=1 Tax=Castilleja foliolosa TaxID=1961234 RepID=A0ABD3D231_9LAMI